MPTTVSDTQASNEPASPLPWTWKPCEHEDEHAIAGAYLQDANDRSVFTEDCGDFSGLSDDNARYIVQACNAYPTLLAERADLLAALKAVVAWREGPEGPDMLFKEGAAMLGRVKAAIDRAEGRAER